jgi:hypothetical protein
LGDSLLEAMEAADPEGASAAFREKIRQGFDPWEIHLSLFPVAERVLNPPFFNGHFPKMYGICRDLAPFLEAQEVSALVQIEINEYAKRPLVEPLPRPASLHEKVSFGEIESAIGAADREKAAALMSGFYDQKGPKELARRILLLGSGYLKESLGHSVSCAAFILREMIERSDQDPWPCFTILSDFYCRSKFQTTPNLRASAKTEPPLDLIDFLSRATSGRGIINLHHTLTWYAMDRTRLLFSEADLAHMLQAWIEFMGEKEERQISFGESPGNDLDNDSAFYALFSWKEAIPVVQALSTAMDSPFGRQRLGRLLVKALCDQYQGNYDPHYLNGLGSALAVIELCRDTLPVALNALFQYLDFYFENLRSKQPGIVY